MRDEQGNFLGAANGGEQWSGYLPATGDYYFDVQAPLENPGDHVRNRLTRECDAHGRPDSSERMQRLEVKATVFADRFVPWLPAHISKARNGLEGLWGGISQMLRLL